MLWSLGPGLLWDWVACVLRAVICVCHLFEIEAHPGLNLVLSLSEIRLLTLKDYLIRLDTC